MSGAVAGQPLAGPLTGPLTGKVAVITGAARGVGAELALALTQRGATVALLGLEPEELAATAERIGGVRPGRHPGGQRRHCLGRHRRDRERAGL
jgi:NAD(P)-dependent dehydrogenase (short-subunit alcohol dehydrogenase family)